MYNIAAMNKGASVAKLYSYTVPLKSDLLNTYCVLQKGFTDQFVYYRKDRPQRYLGLGRCIAIASREDLDHVLQGEVALPTVMFSFNRFDASNPKPADEMMQAFPRLRLMIPEVVLIENEQGCFLQVNSLGPVYKGRIERFLRHANDAPMRERRSICYSVVPDSYEAWEEEMRSTLSLIKAGRVKKLVPSRRQAVVATAPFSPKDVLLNLIDGKAQGTVFLYRYGDVFFCGCTPELLVRKQGCQVESMCLAGTAAIGSTPEEREQFATFLMNDEKNRREHDYVVRFIHEVFERNCYDVDIPAEPLFCRSSMFNISTRLLAHASWRVFPSSLLWSSCIPHQRSLANQWAKRSCRFARSRATTAASSVVRLAW